MRRLLRVCLLLLCGVLLSSCVYVSTGSVLDNIGHRVPQIELVQRSKAGGTVEYHPKKLQLWKKDDLYYVELPVVYVPMACDLITVHLWHGSSIGGCAMPEAEAFAVQAEPRTYYAELTERQMQMLLSADKDWDAGALTPEQIRLQSAEFVDMRTARRLKADGELLLHRLRVSGVLDRLPHMRSTGNQLRRPLCWALVGVDAPLSVGATTLGWSLMILLGPFF